jgi:hypothetical protein
MRARVVVASLAAALLAAGLLGASAAQGGTTTAARAPSGPAQAGCVSVSASRVVWLLRHLRPGAAISIGVGARAYATVPVRRT